MNVLIKPSSLLLYLLVIFNFFFIGALFAKLVGAGEGQGLAAGAIVVGYSLLFAFLALIGSILFVYFAKHKTVVLINKIMLVVFIIAAVILTIRIINLNQKQETQKKENRQKITSPPAILI
jgi:cytochrome bd-type quinol oxidase subunit 2